MSLAISCPQ